jgi:hypothetical protein
MKRLGDLEVLKETWRAGILEDMLPKKEQVKLVSVLETDRSGIHS